MKRVVITGYGVVNALGKNKAVVEKRLFKGESGLSQKAFASKDGDLFATVGEVKDLTEVDSFFAENNIPYDRCAQLAIMAAAECLEHAGIDYSEEDAYRRGVAIGTSLGGMLSGQTFHRQWLHNGIENADEKYLYLYPLHAMADVLAKKFCFKGVKNIISTACAASGNIVGYGMDMVKSGKYDFILAGGVDPLSSFSFAGFNALKALDPEACKPYSGSHGINLGEGGAFVLLEDYEHAMNRNAHIYAEVIGYGLSADAYHPTAPDLGGGGASRAMMAAVYNSGIKIEDISYVNGHGTGTVANDNAERLAFKTVLGDQTDVPLSSIKAAIGHCLGAAGGEECVASVMAINNGLLPPTVNFQFSEKESPINLVPNQAQEKQSKVILSNSFAFGGNNCCLALARPDIPRDEREQLDDNIVITGMGCCGVGGTNITELWDTFKQRKVCIGGFDSTECACKQTGCMPDVVWKKYIAGKYIRRIDEITKLTMTSGKQALDSGRVSVTKSNMDTIGVIYATGTGPLGTIVHIDKTIVEKGIPAISLSEFPNSVINAAPGNFCIANMLKGPTSTLSEGMSSFLFALNYAYEILKNKMAEVLVVVSADECNEPLIVGHDKVHLISREQYRPLTENADGMVMSPGSVAVILESEEHAKKRNATIYAAIKGYSSTSDNAGIATVSSTGEELAECVSRAVRDSGLNRVDLYVNAAMGIQACDDADIHAVDRLLSKGVLDVNTRCSAVSPLLGVASGSHPGYGLLNILYSFENQEIVGMPAAGTALRGSIDDMYVKGQNLKSTVNTACLSGISLGGAYSSVVLQRYQPQE